MTLYQQIKAELSARRENTRYFNKQFLLDYLEAEKQYRVNRKNGIDNTYELDNVTYTREYDKIYCPETEAQNLRRKAENLLIDTFAALCPSVFTADDIKHIKLNIIHKEKFINIAMGIGLATEKEETI